MGPTGQQLDITILQGKTFFLTLRWASEPYVYKPITAIANTAPLRLTVPEHGLLDGWRFAVVGAQGMRGLNAAKTPPAAADYLEATVIDADTLEVNAVNGLTLPTYGGGGVIQYLSPVSLQGMSARMSIKNRIGGTRLMHLSSDTGEITLDEAQHRISIRLSPEVTEAIDWSNGVYDLEIFNANDVYLLTYGTVSVTKEVTRSG